MFSLEKIKHALPTNSDGEVAELDNLERQLKLVSSSDTSKSNIGDPSRESETTTQKTQPDVDTVGVDANKNDNMAYPTPKV